MDKKGKHLLNMTETLCLSLSVLRDSENSVQVHSPLFNWAVHLLGVSF